jgi:hypothetical protein
VNRIGILKARGADDAIALAPVHGSGPEAAWIATPGIEPRVKSLGYLRSNTSVLFTAAPLAFVPLTAIVSVLPSPESV